MNKFLRLSIVLFCLFQTVTSLQSQAVKIEMSGSQKWIFIDNRLEPDNSGKSLFIGKVAGFNDDLTNNRNVFLGDSTGFLNTMGYDNVAVGFSSLLSNTEGYFNTGIGAGALALNTTGYENTAIGAGSLLSNVDGYFNTAVGTGSLRFNLTGIENTAVGSGALLSNADGSFNAAFGFQAMHLNISGFSNTALGYQSMFNNIDGIRNTATGLFSLYQNVDGHFNTAYGYRAMYENTSGTSNVAMGYRSLTDNTIGIRNSSLGSSALSNNTEGSYNTASGFAALETNTTGSDNTAYGHLASYYNQTGSNNTTVGSQALFNDSLGVNNTSIGHQSGYLAQGSNNIFLGYRAGFQETGSDKLYINNDNSTTPLIWGDFLNDTVRINGTLDINNSFRLPNADGNVGHILKTDGAGQTFWSAAADESNMNEFNTNLILQNNQLELSDAGGTLFVDLSSLEKTTVSAGNSINLSLINDNISAEVILDGAIANLLSISPSGLLATEADPKVGTNQVNYISKWDGSALVKSHGLLETVFGNVGIGVALPLYKLDVAGGMRINEGQRELLIPDSDATSGVILAAVLDGIGNHPQIRLQDTTAGLPGSRWFDLGGNSIGDFELQINDATKMTIKQNGNIGIDMIPVTNRLEVNGSASNSSGGNWLVNSDQRLKKNIKYMDAEHMLQKVLEMKGASYEWNDEITGNNRPEGIRYGFIAQDLQKIWPTRVEEDNRGYLQTAYGAYDAMFVESIKALNTKNELLVVELEKQKKLNATMRSEMEKLNQVLDKFEALAERMEAMEAQAKAN